MRRADRLFQIIQILRAGRLVTARDLADRLEISERTVYRDMADLIAQGVPVEGAAGVGYLLREEIDLPPLTFTRDELESLVLGARMVQAWGGPALALAAARALEKVEAAVPNDERRRILSDSGLHVPDFMAPPGQGDTLEALRRAINTRQVLALDYVSLNDDPSTRVVWPLGLHFWGKTWTLAAWCELRDDFRTFRVDRVRGVSAQDRDFPDQPGCRFSDYLQRYMQCQPDRACESQTQMAQVINHEDTKTRRKEEI